MFKRRYKLLYYAQVILPILFWFNNCGDSWKALSQQQVSLSCGTEVQLNHLEVQALVEKAHNDLEKVRCPGFFAVLKDEQSTDLKSSKLSQFNKTQYLQNNCNQNGPTDDSTIPNEGLDTEELIKVLITETDSNNILENVTKMSDNSLWPTRHHASSYNNDVSEWIKTQFETMAQGRTDVTVRRVSHSNTPQDSVEVIIKGNGPNKDKFVIIGGHEDSIVSNAANNDTRSPGADDNASGVAVLMETFRVLMSSDYRPDHSIAIYTYAAEEVGLVGSQEIANSYVNSNKEVIGVMQLDMAMFSTQKTNDIYFIDDFTSAALTSHAAGLVKKYLGMNVLYTSCGYACSDHASWNKNNYKAIMPAEKYFQDSIKRIHSVNDIVNNQMDADYAEKFAHLAIAFVVSLAE